ncbi:MAG: 50S ribosomal protein L6 [Deltaproteobacteria bacterium RIFOXYD12_FULL_57_12]|nr:MAG: 50S ribosomal protein L6 [Deltaproteobacteria bacterium RIFOXYD12_FULL_57_12]
MSRIGNKPIPLPKGIKVEFADSRVRVTGPKGTLEREIRPELSLAQDNANLLVITENNDKKTMALKGMTRSLVNNMVVGVDKGFLLRLAIEGVGYKAEVDRSTLKLSVGYSNQVLFDLPAGVTASVDKTNTITLEAIDKELLGMTAATIRAIRKPEPYKGKGIRYEFEHIVRKVGKSGSK